MATSGRDGVTTGREAIDVLVAARKERGLSQADLAGLMGVSASVVRRLESGGGSPRLDTLAAVAQGLGLRLDLRFVQDASSTSLSASKSAPKSAAAASKGAGATAGGAKRGADAPGTKAAGQGSRAKSPEAAKAKAATRPAAAKDQRKPAGARPSREVLPVKRTATRRRFT